MSLRGHAYQRLLLLAALAVLGALAAIIVALQHSSAIAEQATTDGHSAIVSAVPTLAPPTSGGELTIMPLGDSITEGYPAGGGYRVGLWHDFVANGWHVHFVGSLSGGPPELGDKAHEGHDGFTIQSLSQVLTSTASITTYQPQIVLLHAGTNDILSGDDVANAPLRLAALIDQIVADDPGVRVLVASIIPNCNPAAEQQITQYDAAIPGIVQQEQAQGKSVYFVDMHDALTCSDLVDGTHPTPEGYDKMAAVWYTALVNLMGGASSWSLEGVSGPGTWTFTGSEGATRYAGTATLLADGTVLVAGGAPCLPPQICATLSSAQLYDPRGGTWTSTGSSSTARDHATATLLPDGRVLVAGGETCGPPQPCTAVASAELYDPSTHHWTPTGSLSHPRAHHTATLLADGKVLVAGGIDNAGHGLNSAELYDPRTGRWTPTGHMTLARFDHTATLLRGGRVLVAGGAETASTEIYSPRSGTWRRTGAMSTPRHLHTATLLASGEVLVAGGFNNSAELYNPRTGLWTRTGSMVDAREGHTATLLGSGLVLVAGGYPEEASAELYDPVTGRWSATGTMNVARGLYTATLLDSGAVLVEGGCASLRCQDAELYRPVAYLSTTRTSVNMGNQPIGTQSTQQPITITNTSPETVTVAGVALSGPDATTFSVSSDTCSTRTLAPNGTCALEVAFTPARVGRYSATLSVTDTAFGNPQSVTLSGAGVPPPTPTPMPTSAAS